MRRIELLIALSLAPLGHPVRAEGAPDAGEAVPETPPPADSLCAGALSAAIDLEPGEFHLFAYDVARQLLAVRPLPELPPGEQRRVTIRLRSRDPDVLLPVPPDVVSVVREDHHAGRLHLALLVRRRPEANDAPPPQRSSPCRDGVVEVEPTRAWLHLDDFVLSERDLRDDRRRIAYPEVEVGPIQVAAGTPAVERQRLTEAIRTVGIDCLRRATRDVPSVQGAMTIELRESPVGQPERPRILVDAVVFSPLSNCLPSALFEARPVWDALPAGGRVFVPFYFRGSPVVLPPDDGPLSNETKAP